MSYRVYVTVFTGATVNDMPGVERLKAAECSTEEGALQLARAYVGQPFGLPESTWFRGRTVGLVIAATIMPKE